MASDSWRGKVGAYADGELSAAEMRAMGEHLRSCPSCTSDVLSRVQLRLAVKSAGKRYAPSLALRQRIEKGLPAKSDEARRWDWVPKLIAAVAVVAVAFVLLHRWTSSQQSQTFAELADIHISTLASAAPVDVISTDRHTVKPWFQGKLPFTFNLPELANSPFTLVGGRVTYLDQTPGAHLIYKVGSHEISVFIFQNRLNWRFPPGDNRAKHLTFNVESFTADDLRFFVIGDAGADNIHKLSEMLKLASQS
jgi:anti-sigma factor RsiW